jgi:hypothetical protein
LETCNQEIIDDISKILANKGYTITKTKHSIKVRDETAPHIYLEITVLNDRILIKLNIDNQTLLDTEPDEDLIDTTQRTLDELLAQAEYIGQIISPACKVEKDIDSIMDAYQSIDNIIEEYT